MQNISVLKGCMSFFNIQAGHFKKHLTLITYLDTEVATVRLPVHLTVGNTEQVLHSDLLPTWNLKQDHTSRNILIYISIR